MCEYLRCFKFSDIKQYDNVIDQVRHRAQYIGSDSDGEVMYDTTKPLPTLYYTGTVKLHGTNSAIGFIVDSGTTWYQSRERLLSLDDDCYGFMAHFVQHKNTTDALLAKLKSDYVEFMLQKQYTRIIIYGEWCGGRIKKKTIINTLPKMFVVFAVKFAHDDGTGQYLSLEQLREYIGVNEKARIFNTVDFGTYSVVIDFEHPEESQEILTQLTLQVEKECPAAKCFGVSGLGEGIVWTCDDSGYTESKFRFKTKGKLHSAKIREIAPVDIEKLNSIKQCVETLIDENRLEQGLDHLNEYNFQIDESNIGIFIRWVVQDCIKEEADTIAASGLPKKEVHKAMSHYAKNWFKQQLRADT